MRLWAGAAAAMGLGLAAAAPAQAALVYDSGAPRYSHGTSLRAGQSLAGHFAFGADVVLTGGEIYLAMLRDLPQPQFTMAIYSEASRQPGFEIPGQEIYSTVISGGNAGEPGWHGALDLDWALTAGSYWIVFEVRPGQNFYGVAQADPPDPLIQYAFMDEREVWITTTFGMGLRLYADDGASFSKGLPSAAPEPATWAMLILGFGAVGGAVRRNRRIAAA